MHKKIIPRSHHASIEDSKKEMRELHFEPKVTIEAGLKAGIKDPLWFLSRQWQMGEFEASNGGSPIRSTVNYNQDTINNIFDDENGPNELAETIEVNPLMPIEIYAESGGVVNNLSSESTIGSRFWNSERLEYRFKCRTSSGSILCVNEHYGEHLDWHNFSISDLKIDSSKKLNRQDTMLPTRVKFPGMPKPRWWQFEDENIDLGDINRVNLNFLSSVLTQFGLSYSNDWFIVPLPQDLSTIRTIIELKVYDTFNNEFLLSPFENNDPLGFSMFMMNNSASSTHHASESSRFLFLPNTIAHSIESDPLEEVVFFRDDIANLVWANERKYTKNELTINRIDERPSQVEVEKSEIPIYKFKSPLPENWIPFIAKKLTDSSDQIILRRGRTTEPENRSISTVNEKQYRGQILEESKYIREEEIPSIPIQIIRHHAMTTYNEEKWLLEKLLNGKYTLKTISKPTICLWEGRKKKPTKLMEKSNLRFDYLVE